MQQTPINDAGLSDAQRDQLYQQAAARGWQCYAAWIATLDPATLPYATLPHSGMPAQYLPPDGTTLAAAEADANTVVRGTVVSLSPQANGFGTHVTVGVAQVLKGQAASTIVVNQGSHLEPIDNWQGVLIVDAANAPLLLPGDDVFLFLQAGSTGLYQESFTGTYYVRGGLIQALQLNPFANGVNGKSAAAFAAILAVT